MAAPPITERHKHHFHRQSPIKESVRVATIANITISTALNNGDSLDGVTLATDDRVLVKDQSTASQNGIYVVGASPVRDYDESTDDPGFGYLVFVREGTTNGGTLWKNGNTAAPTIGSTSITFSVVGSGATGFATPTIVLGTAAAAGAAPTVIRSDATIVAFDATAPVTQALGDTAATGSAAVAARRDHKHGMPALSTATPLVESGAGATGTGSLSSREDHVHPAAAAASDIWVVDPGTFTYTTTTGDVDVARVSKFGITSGGVPYYNAANVTAGDEAALIWNATVGDYALRRYS